METYFSTNFSISVQAILILIQVVANHRSELKVNDWEVENKEISCSSWNCQLFVVSINPLNQQQQLNQNIRNDDKNSIHCFALFNL